MRGSHQCSGGVDGNFLESLVACSKRARPSETAKTETPAPFAPKARNRPVRAETENDAFIGRTLKSFLFPNARAQVQEPDEIFAAPNGEVAIYSG